VAYGAGVEFGAALYHALPREPAMKDNLRDGVELPGGGVMPWLGLGTWQSKEGDEVKRAVLWALEAGYRHIDTAAVYGNERGVGEALRESGVPRAELFITTKLWNEDQRRGTQRQGFERSLERLGLDYVDLYLIHWPVVDRIRPSWRVLEELHRAGRARAIGVSNFQAHHLRDLLRDPDAVRPMVNQCEFHPYLLQAELRAFCEEQGVVFEGWSPLMRGQAGKVIEIVELAEKYNKSPEQLVLRWSVQHGAVTIPKSVKRERIVANAQVFDFEIADEDMAAIDALDRGERTGPDPDNFNF
jgi:diketogulonate reductase-like aldo/keto reductase